MSKESQETETTAASKALPSSSGSLRGHLEGIVNETDDFLCIAATTTGRVRIGFEMGQYKRCEIPEAERVLEILTDAIRHAKMQNKC